MSSSSEIHIESTETDPAVRARSGFTWEYAESGPEQWQVRIGRVADDV